MQIKVVLEKQEDGGYTVYIPSLPGCISEGNTKKEALKNIREALELYLDASVDETIATALNSAVPLCTSAPRTRPLPPRYLY